MAYKDKLSEAVNLTPHGHYTHVYRFQIYGLQYRKQSMSAKQENACVH